jgi:cell division transport system permease protein
MAMLNYTLREALAGFRRTPLLTGLSAAMIALSLFVMGLFGIAAHNIRVVLEQVEARVEVVAYLRDDAAPAAVERGRADIAGFPEVLEVFYISREQALETARRELRDFEVFFTDLDVNPLPASLEIRLKPGERAPQSVRSVADRVSTLPFVEDVRYGREWLDKIYLLRQVAGAAAVVVGGTFAAVAALIIGSAIRMSVHARREEIAIMRLVGATDGFVRRPFVLEGLLTGLVGGSLALLMTFGVFRVISEAVIVLRWIPDAWTVAGIVTGGVLGALASSLALRRYLADV